MAGGDIHILDALRPYRDDLKGLFALEHQIHTIGSKAALARETIPADELLTHLQNNIHAVLPHVGDAGVAMRLLFIGMSLRAMTEGRDAALGYAIGQICNPDLQKIMPAEAYKILAAYDWLKDMDIPALTALTAPHAPGRQDARDMAVWKSTRILWLLGLQQSADMDWLRVVFEAVAAPWILKSLDCGHDDCALAIEHDLYAGWLRRAELLDHYEDTYARWAAQMKAAGLRQREKLGAPNPAPRARPLVGIVVHGAAWLAHLELLHQTLGATKDKRDYDLKLYVLTQKNEDTARRFTEIGVECAFLQDTYTGEAWSRSSRFIHLRKMAERDGANVMIWLCLSMGMGYAFAMGLAPYQVYWSMKMFVKCFTVTDDDWLSFNGAQDALEYKGKSWKLLPITFTPSPAPDAQKLADIRAKYAGKTILGTLARTDKLVSPDFLNTICDALERNPDAIYLYTGREDLHAVRSVFQTRGLAHRAHFIGWVDVNLYARVFDVYLDSWPSRSGVTMFSALEAKIPMMFYMGDYSDFHLSRLSFFFFRLQEKEGSYHLDDKTLDDSFTLPDGSRALLAFDTHEKYLDALDRLIREPDWRKKCGEAGRTLYTYLSETTHVEKRVNALMHAAIAQSKGGRNAAA